MTRTFLTVLLAMACSPVWAQVGSTEVPAQLPADIKDWVEYPSCHVLPPCELKLVNAVVEYDLYVKPGKGAIYAVSHYRVRPTQATGLFEQVKDYHGLEVVHWFPEPGVRTVPHRVFIKRDGHWQEAAFKSPEWYQETTVVNRLWRVRADALEAEETLATTVF